MTKIKFDLTDMKKENLIQGFDSLSEKFFLEEAGNLVVLGAWTGVGKTAFALNWAMNTAKFFLNQGSNKGVGIISLESSEVSICQKMFAIASEIDFSVLKTGKLNEIEYNKIQEIGATLSELPVFISDIFNFNIENLKSKIREEKTKNNLGIIFIDYLQIINCDYPGPDFEKTSFIVRSLKNLSKEINIPIVVLSQVSPKINNRRDKIPTLLDFGMSSSLAEHADIILFLHREELFLLEIQPDPGSEEHNCWLKKLNEIYNQVDIIIAKNRHGPKFQTKLHFDPSTLKFKDLQRK
jgi:replicative DNA helicase